MSRRPTQFTRESAERIANVVRAVEAAAPAARPLSFDRVDQPPPPKTFRIATFTGAWAINSAKTVTLKYQTNTPNTVSATNLFFPITSTSSAGDCAIAKDGTAWVLIDVPFSTASAVFVTQTTAASVLTSVSFNANNCSLNTQATTVVTIQQAVTATYLQFGV